MLGRGASGAARGFAGALALFVLASLGPLGPLGAIGLVSIPFVLLAVALRPRNARVLLLAAMFAAVELALIRAELPGIWQVERGWALLVAGAFAAASSFRSEAGFLDRALVAIAGSAVVAAGIFLVTAADWTAIEGMMEVRMQESLVIWTENLGERFTDPVMKKAFEDGLYRAAELQVMLIPATLAAATLGGLGGSWWLWSALAGRGGRALSSLADFRFREELIWILILGLAMALPVFDGRPAWVGLNIAVIMGVLYATRGAGVVIASLARSSIGAKVLLGLLVLLFPPGAVITLFLVGVGDNWMDIRARIEKQGEVQ